MKNSTKAIIVIFLIVSFGGVSGFLIWYFSSSEGILNEVRFWAYQIQGIDEDGAVEALVDSHYDLLVLEPTRSDKECSDFDTEGMVEELHASEGTYLSSKLVVAYIDIGEAEDWRWYWDDSWIPPTDTSQGDPDFLLTVDPDGWSGNYPVAYWDSRWKDIMLYGEDSSIQQILDDGFDGIYMDWIEAYDNDVVIDVAETEGLDPQQEMIDFISEIRDYCCEQNPAFLLIAQNALAICEEYSEYFGIIDAVAQEQILFDGEADTEWDDPEAGDIRIPEEGVEGYSTEWYVDMLDLYLDEGLPVFVVDYALDENNAADSYAFAEEHDYIGFVSQRPLSQLPTTVPPDY